jgi:HlyD family secretion protein
VRISHSIPILLLLLLVACSHRQDDRRWLGYAEGEEALIAAPSPGWITAVAVTRGAEIKEGDVLFTLDDTQQRQARDNAAAQVAAAEDQRRQAQADVGFENREYARDRSLVGQGALPRRDLEQTQSSFHSGSARVAQEVASREAAKATLATAEWNLSERTVRARTEGRVEDVYFRPGEYATSSPVVAVLPPTNVYARFFVPEKVLESLHVGDRVVVACDGCPPSLEAAISFIAREAEFTPPVLYSVENRDKLVFKVEARAPTGLPLRPGLPITVTRASDR